MKALFLAHSPMLAQNASITSLDNVNVYPLICHLLNIHCNPNNGTLDAWTPYMKKSAEVAVHTSGQQSQ